MFQHDLLIVCYVSFFFIIYFCRLLKELRYIAQTAAATVFFFSSIFHCMRPAAAGRPSAPPLSSALETDCDRWGLTLLSTDPLSSLSHSRDGLVIAPFERRADRSLGAVCDGRWNTGCGVSCPYCSTSCLGPAGFPSGHVE